MLKYPFPLLLSKFKNLESLYFINCELDDDNFCLSDLPSFRKLGFIRCEVTSKGFSELLRSIDPCSQPELFDLTGNKLGEDPQFLIKFLKKFVTLLNMKTLILSDNGLDENTISEIKDICHYNVKNVII